MDVGIIGAGSVGMLMGSYMAEAGLSVTMLVRDEQQGHELNEKGIWRMNEDHTKTSTSVYATTEYQALAKMNLLIIAVKFKDVSTVLSSLKEEEIQVPLLFIQNGIGHLNAVKEIDFQDLAFATVEHGALKESMHMVRHNGVGDVTIGVANERKASFQVIEKAHQRDFPIKWHSDPEFILLRKGIINCLINPLTTILRVRNGQLIENIHSHQLMFHLYKELMKAFPEIEEYLSFEAVENICKNTARNHSSMLTDYQHGRPMEIDTIVSALIQRANAKKKSLPLLKTYEQLLLVLDKKAKEER